MGTIGSGLFPSLIAVTAKDVIVEYDANTSVKANAPPAISAIKINFIKRIMNA